MKIQLFLISILLIIISSCSKENEIIIIQKAEIETADTTNNHIPCTENGIIYPDSAFFGLNILAASDSAVLSANNNSNYSLHAILDCQANLKIKMSVINGSNWFLATGSSQGWLVSPFSNLNQTFQSINHGLIDLNMKLGGGLNIPGSCRIDFYENSSTITRTKYLFWQ